MDHHAWDTRYAATDLVWGADPNRFVVSELAHRAPQGRALDLACGEGRNAIWLAEQGWKVTGVDFSRVAIERARELAEKRRVDAEWCCADLTTYHPPEAAFHLVLIAYLQWPEAEMRVAIAHAADALVPGGEILMIGHARRNLREGIGGPQDPDVLWTPEELEEAFQDLGLSVLRCEHVVRSVTTPNGPREAIDVIARACRPE